MTIRVFVLFCLILQLSKVKYVSCDQNVTFLYNYATTRNYNTVNCINYILEKYFPCGTLTTFVNPSANVDELIRTINEEIYCHRIIVRSFDDRNWFLWTNVYIIMAEDLLELWSGMLDLTKDVFWNPRAKFIVQVNNLVNDDEGIHAVFQTLLKYRMFNIVLLESLKDDAIIYTYRPFENHGCGKHFDTVRTLGTCENVQNITKFYSNRVPNRLRNCTFKVVANDDVPNFISQSSNYTVYGKFVSGLEQYVLDTIAEREGFYLDYEIMGDDISYGIVLPNHTATGLLNFIDREKADIAAGGYILMQNRVELFDYLWGFNYAAYYVYTPAIRKQVWQRVYREFGFTTWLLIAASLFLVVFVGEVLKRIFFDKTFSVLNLWGYFFGNAGRGLSRHEKFRTITIVWAFFTFCISSFYNTALFSLITIHVHEKPHSLNVGNLKNLQFEPCISENSRTFFQYAYNQSLPEGEAIPNCASTDGSLLYAATTKKYYALEMEYSYKLKEYQYINANGKPDLDAWVFSNTNVIVMYLARGFPFIDKFQDYAHRMYEGGLIMNHLKTINLRSYSFLQRHPKPFTEISILDLRMHFCILFVGYILSFICFLLEIWYNYIKEERKLKRRVKLK